MYLLELSYYEFGQFIQIVLWISVPLIVVSMAVTIFLHYRRKRKQRNHAALFPEQEYGPVAIHPLLSQPANNTSTDNTIAVAQQQQETLLVVENEPYAENCLKDMLQENNYNLLFSKTSLICASRQTGRQIMCMARQSFN